MEKWNIEFNDLMIDSKYLLIITTEEFHCYRLESSEQIIHSMNFSKMILKSIQSQNYFEKSILKTMEFFFIFK
jgi:hypothetical protein